MRMKEKGKMKSEKVRTSLLFTFSLLLFTFLAGAATVDVTAGNLEQDCTLQNGSTRGFGDVFGCVSIATPTGGAVIVGSAFMNPDGSSTGFKPQNFSVTGYAGKPEYARGIRGQVSILTVDDLGRFGALSKSQFFWYDMPGTKYGWYDSKGKNSQEDMWNADIGSLGSGFMVTGAKDLKLLNAGFVNDGEITFDLPKCGACVLANPRSTRLHPTDVTVSGYTVPTSGAVTLSVLDSAGRAVWTCRWIDNTTYYPDGAGWYYKDELTGKMTICKPGDKSLCCEPGDGWWVQGPQNSQTTYKFTINKRQVKVNE